MRRSRRERLLLAGEAFVLLACVGVAIAALARPGLEHYWSALLPLGMATLLLAILAKTRSVRKHSARRRRS